MASALAGWLGWVEFRSTQRTAVLPKPDRSTGNGACLNRSTIEPRIAERRYTDGFPKGIVCQRVME